MARNADVSRWPEVVAELGTYGYGVTEHGVVTNRKGSYTGVEASVDRDRARMREARGKLLWTGPVERVGSFLEQFWFAKKLV